MSHTHERVTHTHDAVTHMNESHMCMSHKYAYGVATISRLLKIQVSFAKEPYQRDYILQKRPIVLRSLLIIATQ